MATEDTGKGKQERTGKREEKEQGGAVGGAAEPERRMPFFATGEIVGDYSLLYLYWREAGDKAEEALLSEKDFQHLRGLLTAGEQARLDQVLDKLRSHFRGRVDPEAAARAAKKYYGIDVPPEEARERVAGILAGWLVEAASRWGMIRLRRGWERRGEEEQQSGQS